MSDSEEQATDIENTDVLEQMGIDREMVHDIIGVGVLPRVPSPSDIAAEEEVTSTSQSDPSTETPMQCDDEDSMDKEPTPKLPAIEIIRKELDNSDSDKEKSRADQASPKPSRELKSILALSKEAKLDTNISHKRKTLEPVVKGKETPGKTESEVTSFKKASKTPDCKPIRYPVTAECEFENSYVGHEEKPASIPKRKRMSLSESSLGGASDEAYKRGRKSFSSEIIMFKPNKDVFCWRCHRDGVNVACETCPRSYHQKCLKQTINNIDHWPCPECVEILKAESTQTRSEAMKGMTLEHLCSLLKFAAKRMIQCNGSEPFVNAVSEKEFPDYKKYIIQPMDLTLMLKNIRENLYGSTQAFEADAKWILHNSIIFNSYQSKLTSAAKTIIKICKQEMAEIENCPSCYENANTKKNTWFIEVCPKPHLLVWAKLKGFPYWPAKAMCSNSSGMVDVRFFGAHDRAWVSHRECYLYSSRDPNSYKQKRTDIEQCIEELGLYLNNLRKVFGEVRLAPFKTPFDPDDELKQLKMLLPLYDSSPDKIKSYAEQINGKGEHIEKKIDESDESLRNEDDRSNSSSKNDDVDTTMEGYGTDEDSKSLNNERRQASRDETKDEVEDDETEDADDKVEKGDSRKKIRLPNFTGKLKIIIPPKRRLSTADSSDSPQKLSRRNSVQSDSSHISNISEKNNRPDNTEQEINSSVSETMSSSNSESSSDIKRVDSNKELSPQSKLRMADKLMKRLSDVDEEKQNDKIEIKEKECTENVDKSEKVGKEKEITIKDMGISFCSNEVSIVRLIADSSKKNDTVEEKTNDKNDDVPIAKLLDKDIDNTSNSKEPEFDLDKNKILYKKLCENKPNSAQVDAKEKSSEPVVSHVIQEFEDSQEAVTIEKSQMNDTDIRNIIHSSLNTNDDESAEPASKKRKVEDNAKESTPSTKETNASGEQVKKRDTKIVPKLTKAQMKYTGDELPLEIEIKSEPESEEGVSEAEDMEAKRKYLSALNISEKQKQVNKAKLHEIRTRSKTEEKKERFRAKDNLSRVIDDVVNFKPTNQTSATLTNKKRSLPPSVSLTMTSNAQQRDDSGEIFVKSFAKMQEPKQRARKSFPTPKYDKPVNGNSGTSLVRNRDILPKVSAAPEKLITTPVVTSVAMRVTTTTTSTNSITLTPSKSSVPPALEPLRSGSSLVILTQQQPQDMVLLPTSQITYTTSIANPLFTMVPPLISSTMNSAAPLTVPVLKKIQDANLNLVQSQNYIPQGDHEDADAAARTQKEGESVPVAQAGSEGAIVPAVPVSTSATATPAGDEFNVLNNCVAENVSRAITDLLYRSPPPKLKPRPPGALSTVFDEGACSSAGPVTTKINSVAHRLGDYFRGMLIETLEDLGKSNNPEATITKLKSEMEVMKQEQQAELSALRKNFCTVLKDVQKSIVEEREKIIEETRAACEAETIRRVEEAKSKQWCANCSKEAQFYCCWNTSYCDYPCQQKHWPKHMGKCTQNQNSGSHMRPPPGQQQLVLRPTNPPKQASFGRIYAKPTKIYMNRAPTATSKTMPAFKTSSGNHLTLVEATPGNYELVGNGPIAVSGKILASNSLISKLKSGNVTVTSPTTGGTKQKVTVAQTKTSASAKVTPVTSSKTASVTISDEDSN